MRISAGHPVISGDNGFCRKEFVRAAAAILTMTLNVKMPVAGLCVCFPSAWANCRKKE
jgi:hypothetical protein